jgi:NAD(P)-dependent dehydrogenase (short-subunit alcohol dehydrogenase family)
MLSIDLTDRRAVVTGANSGIGLGIALALARAGCDVAGCGLEDEHTSGAQSFLEQVQHRGRRSFYQAVDLVNGAPTRSFVEWAGQQLGGIDVVVSNAGRNINKGAEDCTEHDWQANAELNLAAHWRVAQSAKPYLDRAQLPVVVVMGSNQAYRTLANSFPYNVAKAGLTGLVQSLALEWGPHIRTVGIAPGYIDTPMNDAVFDAFPDPAGRRAEVARLHPLGRLGRPDEVGALCAFLCSPLAGFISGTTLLIDGGRSAVLQDA